MNCVQSRVLRVESDGGADCGGDFLQDRREEIMGKLNSELNTNHPHFGSQWNVGDECCVVVGIFSW